MKRSFLRNETQISLRNLTQESARSRMKYYSPKEAADLLGLPLRTIQHRCQQQDVLKQFGRYRISQDELEEWGYISENTLDSVAQDVAHSSAKRVTQKAQSYASADSLSTEELIAELKKRNEVDYIEGFSQVEYSEFLYRLKDYKRLQSELESVASEMEERLSDLRNERDYLRGSLDGYRKQIDKLYDGIQRRDWSRGDTCRTFLKKI